MASKVRVHHEAWAAALVLIVGLLVGAARPAFADAQATSSALVEQATPSTFAVPSTGWNVLPPGGRLSSPDGRLSLVMQGDGNLVEYNPRGEPLWASGTQGRPGAFLVAQSDGNLVIYTAAGQPLWATSTSARPGSRLMLQNDANLVLYGPGPLWANNAVDSTVSAPGTLHPGERITSPDRRSVAIMQTDGNLVVYGPGGAVRWASATHGHPGALLIVQADGNCVIYFAGRALWSTNTFAGGVRLTLRNDGTLVVLGQFGRLWPPLPAPVVPYAGNGRFAAANFPSGVAPNAAGRTVRFSVEIEGGIGGVDPADFAGHVASILLDSRGWQSLDGIRFVPVSAAEVNAGARVDVRVSLSTPATVDRLCAPLPTAGWLSCWNGSRAVINAVRWRDGAATYGNDLTNYRIYLISHEVGHGVGHSHMSCPGPDRPAPVMVQQTITLGGCRPWPWPRQP